MAAASVNERVTSAFDQPVVLFIIGMRINRFWPIGRWLRVARAMPRMIAELRANPGSGYLHGEAAIAGLRTLFFVQYWRSFDALEAYARDPDQTHWPAWRAFNQAIGTDGSVGIFHETFVVPPDARESIYVNMPPFGLGAVAGGTVPATGSRTQARQRMRGAGAE